MALSRFGTVLSLALTAQAWSTYQKRIPNGANVMVNGVAWPGVGHDAAAGGGVRNVFGMDFRAAGLAWTTSLCQLDSDGDGETNGEELGDPSCTWTEGQPDPIKTSGTITHPGLAESNSIPPPVPTPVPTLDEDVVESPEEEKKVPTRGPTEGPMPPVLVPTPVPTPLPVPSSRGSTPTSEDDSASVSPAWLAIIIVLSLIAVAILAALVFCAYRRKQEQVYLHMFADKGEGEEKFCAFGDQPNPDAGLPQAPYFAPECEMEPKEAATLPPKGWSPSQGEPLFESTQKSSGSEANRVGKLLTPGRDAWAKTRLIEVGRI